MKTLNLMLMSTLMLPLLLAFHNPALLHFDKMEHDFGTIAQGTPQKAVFTLENRSDQPLVLKKVKGSCGCTATSYTKEAVAPGTNTEIEATFNAKSLGTFTKTVSVYTNLQEEPFVLTIKGKVEQSDL